MTDIDLFGNSVEEKVLTSIQRSATRQAIFSGRDLYTTEPNDIARFIAAIREDGVALVSPIWEPAAGRGDISKTLIRYGYNVISTDIFPYRDGEIEISEIDFFTVNACAGDFECKTIFTNPPFNMQEDFLKHALSLNVDVIFFVRLSFLSSIRRLKIYEKYNPSYVYVYSARAHCYKGGDINKSQNMIDYCVIMWKPPYRGNAILRWIV
jgi:hypothetical protein